MDSKAKAGSPTPAKVDSARRPSATKVSPSPTQTGAKAGKSTITGTPARSAVRKASATTSGKAGVPKRVFSPVRDPLGNSMGSGDISGM